MTDIEKTIEEARAAVLPANLRFDESWGKLTGESGLAYAAFCAYRDFGPDRNIRRAVEGQFRKAELPTEFSPPVKTPRSNLDTLVARKYRMWRAWATQFRWRERAEDYDQYLDRLKLGEKRKTIEAQEEVYRETIRKMLQVVNKKLEGMEPGELTQGSVGEWLAASIKTERELAGIAAAPRGERDSGGKQLEIRFTSDFEGL